MPDFIRQKSLKDAEDASRRFGSLVQARRKMLGLTQDDVALASGVSRRFVIELERGRPTCELGRSLLVAAVVGLQPLDAMNTEDDMMPLLPDPTDERM